jgi:hypothetical protein
MLMAILSDHPISILSHLYSQVIRTAPVMGCLQAQWSKSIAIPNRKEEIVKSLQKIYYSGILVCPINQL